MVDASLSMLIEPLISNIEERLTEEISLIKNVKQQLKHVSFKLRSIQNVLQDAEKRSVTEETVKCWLDELKDISYEMEDVLDEWNTSISKRKLEDQLNSDLPRQKEKISFASLFTSCISPFKQIGLRHDIGSKIKDIDERLDYVVKDMNDFKFILNQNISYVDSLKIDRVTNSIIKESETYGRQSDEKTILSKLLSEDSSKEVNRIIPIVSLVGVGGLGKTTLAKLVFNNDKIVKRFSKRIWVCVSDPFDMYKVAREIIEAIERKPPNESSPDLLLKHLKESICNVKFLLVLDDVWDEEGTKWVDLRNCLEDGMFGSKILVTTRKEKVAKVMGTKTINIHHLEKLSEEACWSLFSQIAFDHENEKKEKLEMIGLEIVKKCKGLPLAVRTLGNVLRFKNTIEEWEHILRSEIWKIENVDVELFPHLYLSYNELPSAIKRCVSYCSIFPKDTRIDVSELIKMWMAQGYVTSSIGEFDVELKGKEYFNKLAASCFFQEFEGGRNIMFCKMHDIVHDFIQYLTSNEIIIIDNEIQNSSSQKARHRHVNWPSNSSGQTEEEPICDNMGNLRSVFIHNYPHQQLGDLISHLKCVRSLVLKSCNLKKLPKEIGSLVHLRLLNLANNKYLDELPESLCELYNLQTLNICYCYLKRLPQDIGKLINLRHLLNGGAGMLVYPKSFERLTGLRTLLEYMVGKKYGKLEYLKNFKHIRGTLKIQIDCSDFEVKEMVNDAHKSQLINNIYIQYLELRFVDNKEAGVHNAVLEALVPPSNVTRLNISRFYGTQYPSWLTNNSNFNKLTQLTIQVDDCFILPPLWKLPNLE